MLPSWQLKFTENGNTTDDPTMTMDCLVDFMEQQRIHYNAQVHNRHNIRQPQYPHGDYHQPFPRHNNRYQPSSWNSSHYY